MKKNKQLHWGFFLIMLLAPFELIARNAAPWVGATINGIPCGGGEQGYGPWDYTVAAEKKNMPIVEHSHFTPKVENHIEGESGYIVGDLDYTLRAIPNHHKALLSAIRYQLKINKDLLVDKRPLMSPIECYLQRAIHFSPKDAFSVSLYAYYFKELGQLDKAAEFYEKALAIAPDNAKIQYSYSLLLIDLKQYEKAVHYAEKAYANGKAPPGLKDKLIKLGVWKLQKIKN